MTVGLDLSYRLIAKAQARVHHGRGQATPFVVKRLVSLLRKDTSACCRMLLGNDRPDR